MPCGNMSIIIPHRHDTRDRCGERKRGEKVETSTGEFFNGLLGTKKECIDPRIARIESVYFFV